MQQQTAPAPAPVADRIFNANYIKLWFGMLFYMLNMSAYNLLPYYLELRGAGAEYYGSVAGSMGISNVLSLVLLGRYADRWSRKTTITVYFVPALLGNLLAIWAMGQADLDWYFAVRLLQGLFMGLGFPMVFTWTVELTPPQHKHLALAWVGIGGILANSLGPTLGELLLNLQGAPDDPASYRAVWVMALGFQLAALVCFRLTKNVRSPEDVDGRGGGLFSLMRRSESLLVLLVATSFGGMFGVLMSFSKNFTASLALPYVSVLLWAYSIGAIMSRVFMAQIMRRIAEQQMIPLGLVGMGFSFLLLSTADGYGMLGFAGFLYGLSHGILYPTLFVRFLNFQRPSETGRAATLFQGFFSMGWGLIPLVGGTVLSHTNFPSLFSLLATLAGAGIFLHLRAESAAAGRRSQPQ